MEYITLVVFVQYVYPDAARKDIHETLKAFTDLRPDLKPYGIYLGFLYPSSIKKRHRNRWSWTVPNVANTEITLAENTDDSQK